MVSKGRAWARERQRVKKILHSHFSGRWSPSRAILHILWFSPFLSRAVRPIWPFCPAFASNWQFLVMESCLVTYIYLTIGLTTISLPSLPAPRPLRFARFVSCHVAACNETKIDSPIFFAVIIFALALFCSLSLSLSLAGFFFHFKCYECMTCF